MVKKTVISKGLFLVLGVILSTFVLCTNGERDNILDSGSPKHSKPISITVKANKDTVFINDTVILKIDCVNESILDYFIWKTGKEEDETVEDFISYTWKNEGLKIISVYAVDKLTRVSEVVFCTVFVELGKPIVELESDTITTYINDTVECVAHATDNGTIKKYNWTTNIKNIEMSNDSIQKIVSKDTGLFFVIVSVEDNDSVSSLADTCVVIIKEGKPKAQIEFDTSIIEIRETVTISVDTSDENGVIKKFIWEYTSKNRDSTVHDTTKPGSRDFVWNDTGFVTISVIAVDDDGLFSETSRCTIYVDIGPKPTVLLDSNIVNSYINDSTTITATGSDENGTVTGFLWKEAETGKTYSTVDGQFSFVWREAGTRKITVQAVDNDGQLSDYDTCVIYIDSGIPVAIAHPNTIGSTTRQDGITVTLEAKDNNLEGELVWFWDTGSPGWDDSTSGPTRTFTSSNGGVVTIIWAVRDDDNLFSKKDTFQISFNSPPCSTEIVEPKEIALWNSFNKNSSTGSVKCIWTFDDPDSASDIKRCKLLIRNDYGTTMYTFQRDVSSSTFDTILTFATLSKYTWNMVVYDIFGDSTQSSGSFTTSFGSPVISEDPIGSTVFKGDTVTFSVIAEGNELLYQWYIDGTYAIPSANKAQYSLNSVDYADSIHEYYCIVSNPTGSDTSETVSIRVLPVKPVIDSIHYDTTVTQSEGAVFTVFASGEFLEYQWQKNGADILVDGSVLTIDSVALADNGSQFRCIVSNAGGSDTSEVMTLEVALALPVIISNPSDTTVVEGNRICLKVEAIGDSIKYQWQKDSTDLTGKTLDSLVIPIAAFSDSGKYRCLVSNSAGTVWSNEALLEVDSSFTLDITTTTGGTATPSETVYLSSGSSCSITATPSEGYVFSDWTVESGSATITNSSSASTSVKITENTTIRANFNVATYTLSILSSTGGSTYPSGAVSLESGERRSIIAIPSAGYVFDGWAVISGNITFDKFDAESTVVNISENSMIRANFIMSDASVTVQNNSLFTIYYLHVISDTVMGYNRLGTSTITPGASFIINNLRPGMYDFVVQTFEYSQFSYCSEITLSAGQNYMWEINNSSFLVLDNDLNSYYTTVVIGNQVWTVENLRTTKYNDGTPIPLVTDSAEWANLCTPGYCFYNNTTSESEQSKWGALYNWYAVNTGKLAPSGWRVPTDDDWVILQNYLIANGYNYDGSVTGNKIAKSLAAKIDWKTTSGTGAIGYNPSSNNSTNFSAMPVGFRLNGVFRDQDRSCGWWTATSSSSTGAWARNLNYASERLCGGEGSLARTKSAGFSIRLVRDLN